jgi:hypothetical protein
MVNLNVLLCYGIAKEEENYIDESCLRLRPRLDSVLQQERCI